MNTKLATVLAALALPAFAAGTDNQLYNCLIQEVLPGKHMTAAFFTLEHQGEKAEITGAAIPELSDDVQIHQMRMENGVMHMEQIPSYPLQAGENRFEKGGYHLMAMGVKNAPKTGSLLTLTLTFSDGSTSSCQAKVASVDEIMRSAAAEHHHHSNTEHHHHKQPAEKTH